MATLSGPHHPHSTRATPLHLITRFNLKDSFTKDEEKRIGTRGKEGRTLQITDIKIKSRLDKLATRIKAFPPNLKKKQLDKNEMA